MATGNDFGLFWNSDSGDRTYDAESFETWLKKFFTSGVFNGELEVTEYSGVTVSVSGGYTNVDGKVMFFEQATQITLDAPNSTYPRIDTIVVQRDNANRQITLEKVTGAYSGSSPQPTAPVRNAEIYQLVLAQIYVDAGASVISQADITDTRADADICGYVTGTVEEIDFSQITAQFEAYIAEFEAENLATFEDWFDHMKDQLSEDAAGHLQAEIDAMDELVYTSSDDLDPTSSESVALLTSGETQVSRWQKVSQMFKNIRYLLKRLGTTDISSIGDGTITGGISTLNSDLTELKWTYHFNDVPFNLAGQSDNPSIASWIYEPCYYEKGNMLYISLAFSTTQTVTGSAKLGVLKDIYKERLPIYGSTLQSNVCGAGITYDTTKNYGCVVHVDNSGSLYVTKGTTDIFPAYCLLNIQMPLNPAS